MLVGKCRQNIKSMPPAMPFYCTKYRQNPMKVLLIIAKLYHFNRKKQLKLHYFAIFRKTLIGFRLYSIQEKGVARGH